MSRSRVIGTSPGSGPRPAWKGAPEDVLPGVVPVELILGRSDSTVVMLTGMRAFPTGLSMRLGVRVRGRVYRRDLNGEVFDVIMAADDAVFTSREPDVVLGLRLA
jgi:hypothetical protein